MQMLTMMTVSIPDDDFARLIKCLQLTQSDRDGEALAAIRAVNRIMQKNALSWETIWGEMIGQITRELKHRMQSPPIDQILNELLAVLRPGSYRDMIESFAERWHEHHVLSEKQRKTLADAWHRNKATL